MKKAILICLLLATLYYLYTCIRILVIFQGDAEIDIYYALIISYFSAISVYLGHAVFQVFKRGEGRK